jgi:hypothetical protein
MTSIPEKTEEEEEEKIVPVTIAGRYTNHVRPKTVQLPNTTYTSKIIKTQDHSNNVFSNNGNLANLNISDISIKTEECFDTLDKSFYKKFENFGKQIKIILIL